MSRRGFKENIIRTFTTMFRIGCIGFGGGTALIPVIEREVVEKNHMVSEREFNNDVTIACITPGALPVEVATGLGYSASGNAGMIAAATGMALPGCLAMVVLLVLLAGMTETVRKPFLYLAAIVSLYIVWTLLKYAYDTIQQASGWKEQIFFITLMAVVFLSARFWKISTMEILLLAFAGIVLTAVIQSARKGRIARFLKQIRQEGFRKWREQASARRANSDSAKRTAQTLKHLLHSTVAWILFAAVFSLPALLVTGKSFELIWRGLLSSVMSFGGGDAYLSVAQGIFVDTGIVSSTDFYGSIVAVANVLPGSILCKTLTGIGYMAGYRLHASALEGIAVAVCGFAVSVTASGMIFRLVHAIYERYENISIFRIMKRLIRPIISGLLLNVAVTLISVNITV
ncbi:MAG: chromate transporter [Eubacteriales bacterium]|nr:chromate transporter [Eubacteriales bacterium]